MLCKEGRFAAEGFARKADELSKEVELNVFAEAWGGAGNGGYAGCLGAVFGLALDAALCACLEVRGFTADWGVLGGCVAQDVCSLGVLRGATAGGLSGGVGFH